MNKICFHHNDADGKMSAAIVAESHPECKFVEVKYGDDIQHHFIGKNFDFVFIVDFSFPTEVIDQLIMALY